MIRIIGHLMNLCILFSNGLVQKQHIPNPKPRLLKLGPDRSPPIMTLHINTFARNAKWECQPPCIWLTYTPHLFALGNNQDNDIIAKWYNIFLMTITSEFPSCNHKLTNQDNDVIAWWYNVFVMTYNKHVPSCNRKFTKVAH